MEYIKFQVPEIYKNSLEKKTLIGKLLTKIISKANPDYDEKIDRVKVWLVEIDDATKAPNREIGINDTGNIIMTMPDDNNYGYWTDNNLLFEDFKKNFDVVEINKKEFEDKWTEFEKIKDTAANKM